MVYLGNSETRDRVEGSIDVNALVCHTSLLTTDEDLDQLEGEWDELLEDSPQWNFFLRWHWTRLWWKTYAPKHSHLFLVTCRTPSGRLVGLAPLYWQRRRTGGLSKLREIVFLGTGIGIKITEYSDIITRHEFGIVAATSIARFIGNRRNWDRLWLWGIPASSPTLHHFVKALGNRATCNSTDRAQYVDTSTDWETFKQSVGKSSRENIIKHTRRIFKNYSCQFRRVDRLEEVWPAVDALVRLHQSRWQSKGEPGSFTTPYFENFLRSAIGISHARGQLLLWSLTINERIVAVQVGFLDRGRAHAFQVGFDPEFAKLRLGNILFWLCIQDCIESKDIIQFDFMGGGSAYKELLAKNSLDLDEVELVRLGFPSIPYLVESKILSILQSIWRGVVPGSIRAARSEWLRRRRFRDSVLTRDGQG